MAFFVGYPLVEGVRLAFTGEGGGFTLEWVDYLLHSVHSKFWDALKYTVLLAGVVIPIEVALAIGLALLLSRRFRGRDAAIYIIVLPLAISDLAAGLIWYVMLAEGGFLNRLLLSLGVISEPVVFFGREYLWREFTAIVLAEVWRSTAIVFVILFAGLQLVSGELLEAAEVFGASALQKLRYIILPLLKPSLETALIIRTLFAFQVFADVWVLAGRDIPVLAGEAYYEQAILHHTGAAALYALVIAAISVALGVVYVRSLRAGHLEVAA
ncbi:carbohydrate ABC transporter permease [Stetteria hydrogenophila]